MNAELEKMVQEALTKFHGGRAFPVWELDLFRDLAERVRRDTLRQASERYEGRGSEHTSEQVAAELRRLAEGA